MNVQDMVYVLVGDMFELGSKVQVLKKGLFFLICVVKLYELYQCYGLIEEID